MDDAALDDHGWLARKLVQQQTEIVERFDLEPEPGLHEHAAKTQLTDLGRLDDQDLSVEGAQQVNTFRGPAFGS